MQLGDSQTAAKAGLTIASQFDPTGITAAASALVSVFGMGGGHVSRPKHYADVAISKQGFTITKTFGNSDATSAKNPDKNVAAKSAPAIAQAVIDMANQMHGDIPAAFNLGIKYMAKYHSLSFIVGSPISKTNPEFTIDINNNEQVSQAVALIFANAVNKGFIKLPAQLQQQFASGGFNLQNVIAVVQKVFAGIPQAQAQGSQVSQSTALENSFNNPPIQGDQFAPAQNTQAQEPPAQGVNPLLLGGFAIAAILILRG